MKQLWIFLFLSTSILAQAQILTEFQVFSIDCQKDTVIKCRFGTEIKISNGAFCKKGGESIKDGIIQIKVKEAFSKDDMVLEKLSTETKDQLLVSNGMIQVEGFLLNEAISITENGMFSIKIPAFDGSVNMNLYTLDESDKLTWAKSENQVKVDTCPGYEENIIWSSIEVSKTEYKEWEKNTPPEMRPAERLFGGKTINIGSKKDKKYYIDIPVDTLWECKKSSVSYYKFDINEFGWYNIDKLKRIKKPIRIRVKANEDLSIFLVFKTQKICLKAYKKDGNFYSFRSVPANKSAYLIAYKQDDADTIRVSFQEISTSQKVVSLEKSAKISVGAFRNMMKRIR